MRIMSSLRIIKPTKSVYFFFLKLRPWLLSVTLFLAYHNVVEFSSAAEICGRTAIINYQEVLVDTTGNNKKGAGLRYFLEKDIEAKKFLDEYQEKNGPRWYNAVVGTVGTVLFFYGMGNSGSTRTSGLDSKKSYMIGGISLLILNYFLIKTLEYNSEGLLLRSIEEYNKRNLPKIYFSPYKEIRNGGNGGFGGSGSDFGFGAGIIKEF
ncbi:MAG: hypothetical protein HQK53_19390 [Oligoflexia bacterium]|nr:hypothetical protein [Oligoflexia bacterium]